MRERRHEHEQKKREPGIAGGVFAPGEQHQPGGDWGKGEGGGARKCDAWERAVGCRAMKPFDCVRSFAAFVQARAGLSGWLRPFQPQAASRLSLPKR